MPMKSHDDFMREYLAEPEMAAAYLNACIDDGNPWLIADAFKTVAQIHGSRKNFRVTVEKVRNAGRTPSKTRSAKKARKANA
jgi:hypothetical protein